MIRALDTFSFGLCLLGWLLLGIFGTWTATAPFWMGAPLLWASALCGLFTMHWGLRGRLSRSCLVSVLVFTAYVMWRALSSGVDYLARPDIVFGATAFIGWVLTAVRYEKAGHRFALIAVWSLLIVGNLGLGLYQQHGNPGANPLSFLGFSRDYQDAVFGGFFPNSNHLCGFLELTAFPVLAIAIFGRVHSFVRMLCGLVFVGALFAVSQATSRGGLAFGIGIVAFGGVAAVLHLMRKRHAPGRGAAAGVFAAMAVVCAVIGWITWDQLETKFGEGKVFNNLNGRTELWARAHEQWLESPIIGTGARSFEYYERSFRNLRTKWITWHNTDIDALFAHNDWVQMLADYGLIGLILAAAVLGLHSWKAVSFLLTDSHAAARRGAGFFTDYRGAIVMGALCGIIPFAIHCIADFQMHIGVNAVLAAAVLGFMANPGRPESPALDAVPQPSSGRGWRNVAIAAAAVPAAILGWCFVPWAISDYNFQMARGTFHRAADNPGDYFVAASMMQRAVEADPKNYDAWHHWGFADTGSANLFAGQPLVQQQFLKKALDRFMAAHRLYPEHPDISANIGRTLDRLLRYDEADKWFLLALKWGDGSRLIHHYYGDHLMAMGRYEEARDHYNAAIHRQGGRLRDLLDKKLRDCVDRMRKQQEKDRLKREAAPGAAPEPLPQ